MSFNLATVDWPGTISMPLRAGSSWVAPSTEIVTAVWDGFPYGRKSGAMALWQVQFAFFWSPAEYDAWATFVTANRYDYWKMSLAMASNTPTNWAVKMIGEWSVTEEVAEQDQQYKHVGWGGVAFNLG